jgi:hypothetical protein
MKIVPGQHGPRAPGHAWPTALARPATGASEDQVLGIVAWWKLTADRLDD